MQMKALRSANFAKLSSSSATSEAYGAVSISAGTPGGYCLSQIRSMDFPSRLWPCFAGLMGRDGLYLGVLGDQPPMASGRGIVGARLVNGNRPVRPPESGEAPVGP